MLDKRYTKLIYDTVYIKYQIMIMYFLRCTLRIFIILNMPQSRLYNYALLSLHAKIREMATRKSLLNTVYIIGFNVEFTYPSHVMN